MPSNESEGYERLLECYKEETEHSGHEILANKLEDGIKDLQ